MGELAECIKDWELGIGSREEGEGKGNSTTDDRVSVVKLGWGESVCVCVRVCVCVCVCIWRVGGFYRFGSYLILSIMIVLPEIAYLFCQFLRPNKLNHSRYCSCLCPICTH